MSADAGADGRDMLALQATVKDLSARLVALEAKVDALKSSRDESKPEPVDLYIPSEADRAAMVKRLRDKTNQAARDRAEANRKRVADREAGE